MTNNIILIGRISNTLEIKENMDDSKFTIVTLAIPRNFKNNEGIYETDFIDCTLLNNVAVNTVEYCKKGDLIAVRGRVQNLNNTAQLQIIGEKISFLSSRKAEDGE